MIFSFPLAVADVTARELSVGGVVYIYPPDAVESAEIDTDESTAMLTDVKTTGFRLDPVEVS